MDSRDPILARDPTAEVEWHHVDDHFVPIRACDIVTVISEDAAKFGLDLEAFQAVAQAFCHVIEQETTAFQRELADLYADFNPDRDTRPIHSEQTSDKLDALRRRLGYLLEKGNFERLSDVQIENAVKAAKAGGLRVRLEPERIDFLEIWVRGHGRVEREYRDWRHPMKGIKRTIGVFRRLVVVARLMNDPHVLIKIFKDIPIEDVEALLPHAQTAMTWQDRIMMMGGGAGAVGTTAIKLSKLAFSLAMLNQLAWVVLGGAAVLSYRTFMGYRRARSSRDSQRTRHLYFQSIANNAAGLHALAAMIGQEELKEGLLAYAFCHTGNEQAWSAEELAAQVNEYLKQRFEIAVQFDAPDALETLTRLSLWRDTVALRVVPCDEAYRRLHTHWTGRRSEDYHRSHCAAPSPRVSEPSRAPADSV